MLLTSYLPYLVIRATLSDITLEDTLFYVRSELQEIEGKNERAHS